MGGQASVPDGGHLGLIAKEDWSLKRPSKATFHSFLDYHEAYTSGRLTPLQVAERILPMIRRDVVSAKHSVAFLDSRVYLIRRAAEESTARYAAGAPLSPLDGVPMAVKDEQDLTGYRKCLGSKLDFTNEDDATSFCVLKWIEAGALCLGKTNMHELGMDTTNINPHFGTPRNPYNEGYYCGGSSGGSAYAVASGLIPFASGNDGGGAIRIPSSYCGLFGLKPTHGRVSILPTPNLAKSNAVCGPMAANMVDLEIAYRVMAEPDAMDPDGALFAPPSSTKLREPGQKMTLGIDKTWIDRSETCVQKACWVLLDYLACECGYEIVDITIPLLHEGQMAHAMVSL